MPAPIPIPPRSIRFIAHGFLKALEDAGTVGGRTGWTPRHLVLEAAAARSPLARRATSKLTARASTSSTTAGPTPSCGRAATTIPSCRSPCRSRPCRAGDCWCARGRMARATRRMLAAGAAEIAERSDLSGVHITFLSEGEWSRLGARGFLQRTDQQFHWSNAGYATFDDFLASLASRKRKAMRKERERGARGGPHHRMAARPRHHGSRTGTPSSRSTWTPARASGGGPISTASSSRCSAPAAWARVAC